MISVVVPVYNAENYLEDCINSVLSQNYIDFELLLINDGSTDNSAVICDQYAEQDIRVRVFHKENGGVSSARNLGIENATGRWITFVDSDDYISENYFLPTLEYAEQDYIIVNSFIIRDNEKYKFRSYDPQVLGLDFFLKNYNLFQDFATPWGRFFKTSIIRKYDIKFDVNFNRGEDVLFNLEYVLKCKTIAFSNVTFYNYRRVQDSLSNQKGNIKDSQALYNRIYMLLESYTTDLDFISRHNAFSAMRYFFRVLHSSFAMHEKHKMLKELIKRHKKYLITSVREQRIHGLPVKWLIKFELLYFTIFLSAFKLKILKK